jgi:proline iminopeptidase
MEQGQLLKKENVDIMWVILGHPEQIAATDFIPHSKHIPCIIVQGRYDIICPVSPSLTQKSRKLIAARVSQFKTAWDLHKNWPESKLRVVPNAGHSSREKKTLELLVEATDEFRRLTWD